MNYLPTLFIRSKAASSFRRHREEMGVGMGEKKKRDERERKERLIIATRTLAIARVYMSNVKKLHYKKVQLYTRR